MPKTYTAAGTVSAGDVYTAAAHNIIATDVNNFIVPPAARVGNTANITSYTNNTDITWNTETYDTDEMHSTSTNTARITINTPGIYSVLLQIRGTWLSTLTNMGCAIYVDGVERAVTEVYGISTTIGGLWVQANHVAELTAGQYLTSRLYFGGATSMIIATPSYMSATWLGRTS
jgi:hypothetical protein